jgi:hypothetical protein
MTERSPDGIRADGDVRAGTETDTETAAETNTDADVEGDSEFPDEAVLGVPGGADRERPPMEPESVSVENAAFVLLGVGLTVVVLVGAL